MTKSATDLMQEIVFSAVLDAIAALKASSKGLPNTLLRDINAIHANTTFADLPKELQTAISGSVSAAFTRLMKGGYSVSPGQPQAARPPRPAGPRGDGPRGDGPPRGRREGKPPPRHDPNGGKPGPRGRPRQDRKPPSR
jgi:hypothetical protein